MATPIYELSYGGGRHTTVTRYFPAHNMVDAVVRLSEAVLMLDGDDEIGAAWASLKALPEGKSLVSWTKCSNELPTSDGYDTAEAAENWHKS